VKAQMDIAASQQRLSEYVKVLIKQQRAEVPQLPFPDPSAPKPTGKGRRRKLLQSLDLFTGAGGLTLGLGRAGFRPELAVEFDVNACDTFSGLFPTVRIEAKPVEELSFRRFEGIDLVVGGPPCQPFSSGGKGLAARDERDMIPQFIRAVAEARPRAFLMENVSALFGSTHQEYLTRVLQSLSALGYELSTAVLNAAEYGVPQKRRRGFIVGQRKERFLFPRPTHGPRGELPFLAAGFVLSVNAVNGEPNDSKVFYAKTPDLRPSPYDGQLFNGGGRPIDLGAPCHTILASAGGNKTHFIDTLGLVPAYHAHLSKGGKPRTGTLEGGRRLTPEESALIQTFPRATKFCGARSSRYTQIGNAVPPLLAEALGRALRDALA
jgi:DNA (cytosine-5)-methyltransferase 1